MSDNPEGSLLNGQLQRQSEINTNPDQIRIDQNTEGPAFLAENHYNELTGFLNTYTSRQTELRVKDLQEAGVHVPARKPEILPPVEKPMSWKKKHQLKDSAEVPELLHYTTKYTGYINWHPGEKELKAYRKKVAVEQQDSESYKTRMFQKVHRPDMFQEDYFGRNYEDIRLEMVEMRDFLRFCDSEAANLKEDEKPRVQMMRQTFSHMQNCYEKALSVHALKIGKNGVEIRKRAECNPHAKQELSSAIDAFKEQVLGSEQAVLDGIEQQLQREVEQKKRELDVSEAGSAIVNELTDLIKNLDQKKTDKRKLEQIDRMMGGVEAIASRFRSFEADYLSWKAVGKARSRRSFDKSLYSVILEKKIGLMKTQRTACANLLREMGEATRYLITGKGKLSDCGTVILQKYGPKEARLEAESKAGGLYAYNYKLKHKLYVKVFDRKFGHLKEPVPGETAEQKDKRLKEYEKAEATYVKSKLGRAMFLMKIGVNSNLEDEEVKDDDVKEYNDSVLTLLMNLEEEDALKKSLSEADSIDQEKADRLNALKVSNRSALETILQPKFQEIMDFQAGETRNLSQEQFIALQPKVLAVIDATMMVSDLSKRESAEPPLTLREKLLGKPLSSLEQTDPVQYKYLMQRYKAKDAALSAQISLVNVLNLQCRSAALLTEGALNRKDLTELLIPNEAKTISKPGAFGTGPNATIREKVIAMAKDNMQRSLANQEKGDVAFADNEAVCLWLRDDEKRVKEAPTLTLDYTVPAQNGDELVKRSKQLISAEITRRKDENTGESLSEEDVRKELYNRMQDKNSDDALALAVHEKLQVQYFQITGNDSETIRESIFRGFDPSENIRGIREMKKENYRQMLSDLSAGAFLDQDAATEAQITQAREQNKRGLRTYYDAITSHYEAFYEKFGSGVPDLPYIILHFEEIAKAVSSVQVDDGLVRNDKTVLDVEHNPKDERLFHLVEFASYFATVVKGPVKTSMQDPTYTNRWQFLESDDYMANMKSHLEKELAWLNRNS